MAFFLICQLFWQIFSHSCRYQVLFQIAAVIISAAQAHHHQVLPVVTCLFLASINELSVKPVWVHTNKIFFKNVKIFSATAQLKIENLDCVGNNKKMLSQHEHLNKGHIRQWSGYCAYYLE